MLNLEQSFKSAPPCENLSKTVNPAGFRASDPFPKVGVARCKVWLMESDNAMSLSTFQFPGVLSQPHGRYAPIPTWGLVWAQPTKYAHSAHVLNFAIFRP